MPVRILVVDDHEVLREGVCAIIHRARPEWEICGQASDGRGAIDAAKILVPDIILLDITMPKMSGLDAALRIRELSLPSRILFLTMHESGELAGEAQQAGGQGYVTKSDASRNLIAGIEALLAGGTFFRGRAQLPELPDSPPSRTLLRLSLGFV